MGSGLERPDPMTPPSMRIGLAFIYGFIPLFCIIDKFLEHGTEVFIFVPDGIKGSGEFEILNS